MTYVVVNNKEYKADISGLYKDNSWDGRESKTIHATMTFALASGIFKDDTQWKIKTVDTIVNEDGEVEEVVNEYDNSEFSILGDITVHTDGTVSVKMGKPTELEIAYELLYGGN